MTRSCRTSDIWDARDGKLRVCLLAFRDYGGRAAFHGRVETVRTFEDSTLVRRTLETEGRGRVLVIDGGGSLGASLIGGNVARGAIERGWVGVIVHGAIRDADEFADLDIGLKAMGAHPGKPRRDGYGAVGEALNLGGIRIAPGDYLYADLDGIVVLDEPLAD